MLPRPAPFTLSVVVPIYNEELSLTCFITDLLITCHQITPNFEILLINDGSKDNTQQVAAELLQGNIRYVELSRNFGKEAALMAGIDRAIGDAVVLIDGDNQHPIDKLVDMAALWNQGYDMIYGVILNRKRENIFKRWDTQCYCSISKYS